MTFEDWFAAQLPRLLRFTTALCGGPDPAEDVLQDVTIKAHRHWAKLRSLEHPEAYLRRMIVNEHLSWRRKWGRLIPQAELRDTVSDHGFAEQHADRAELVAELAKLPRRQQAVVVLRYFEGMSDVEIGKLLGCRPVTVRSHLSRALASMRVSLQAAASSVSTGAEEESHAH